MRASSWCAWFLVTAVVATGCSRSSSSSDEASVPGRDLSLAELAGAQRPVAYRRVTHPARPQAFQRILDDVAAGTLSPARADILTLQLQLGNLSGLPGRYLEGDASLTVPDFEPYRIRLRWPRYAPAEQAEIRDLLRQLETAGTVADAPGIVERLLGPAAAYAEPAPGSADTGWVEVVAAASSEAGRVGEADALAESVWPQIAALMDVTVGELDLGDVVRFKEPLSPGAQEFLSEQGLAAGAHGEIETRFNDNWLIRFETGGSAMAAADEIELVDPQRSPLKLELVAGADAIPNEPLESDIGGKFMGCRNLYVLSAGAGQCTLAGRIIHELFHCAQSVRAGSEDGYQQADRQLAEDRARWVVEGTAMWAMDHFGSGDNHEWSFMGDYAASKTVVPLDRLMHWAGLYLNYADAELGGPEGIVSIFDSMTDEENRLQLGRAFLDDPTNWHRFVNSSTGYPALTDGEGGVTLRDAGGGSLPYHPATGCVDDGDSQIGQEYLANLSMLSTAEAPVFDVELPGPAAQHDTIQLVDVQNIQYIDVALFGELAQMAASADPELRITAVLETSGGDSIVKNWTEEWASADGPSVEIADFEGEDLSADASLRICMTNDVPCQDESETYPDLEQIRLVISWAGLRGSAEDKMKGQLALIPGAIRGWRGKLYRRGTPDEEHGGDEGGN